MKSTSIEARKKILKNGKKISQQIKLLKLYNTYKKGLTDYEASKKLHIEPSTVSARRNDIINENKDLLIENGRRDNGLGRSTAVVWRIKK